MMMVKDKSNQSPKPSTPSPKPSQPSEREIIKKGSEPSAKPARDPEKSTHDVPKKQQ
jgi:hypothetical protein